MSLRQIIFLTLSALGFLIFASLSFAQTLQTNAELSFENIDINVEKIDGVLSIENNAGSALNSVALSVTLEEDSRYIREKKDGPAILKPGQTITADWALNSNKEKFFNIPADDGVKLNFSVDYPRSVPGDDYFLRATLYDFGGKSLAATLRKIKIIGSDKFLKINPEDCRIFVAGDAFMPQDSPNFFEGEKPKISCKIANPNQSAITALPIFQTNEFSLFRNARSIPEEKIGEEFTLKAGESKTVELTLLSDAKKPQVYETGLLLKTNNGDQISGYVLFRWIIKGAAARISAVEFDKDGYFKNDVAKISLKILQSPDLYWNYFPERIPKNGDKNRYSGTPLNQLSIALDVKTGRGSLCGSSVQTYGEIFEEGVIAKVSEVPMKKNCANPEAHIKIFEGENLLDSLIFKSESLPSTVSTIRKEVAKFWLVIAAIFIFIAGLILTLKNRIRNKRFY